MKQKLIVLPIMFIITITLTLALENWSVNCEKTDYVQGETVLAEVIYDMFDVNKLHLYDPAGNEISTPFYFLSQTENMFMVHFNLPPELMPGNDYKLILTDRRVINNELVGVNIESKFNVQNGNNIFIVKPLWVSVDDNGTVKIKVEHVKGGSFNVMVNTSSENIKPVRDSLTIELGEIKSLTVNYDKLKNNAELMLSNDEVAYKIKFIAAKETLDINETNITQQNITQLPTEPLINETQNDNKTAIINVISRYEKLEQSLLQNQTLEWKFSFNSTKTLHNVTFRSSLGLKEHILFDTEYFPVIIKGKKYEQKITFNKKKNIEPGTYYDVILIESDEGVDKKINVKLTFGAVKEQPIIETNFSIAKPNVSLNFSEINNEDEKGGNLKVALILILITLTMAALIVYKLRPKKKVKQLNEYITELKSPKKKKS